jgi:hypothetical protein
MPVVCGANWWIDCTLGVPGIRQNAAGPAGSTNRWIDCTVGVHPSTRTNWWILCRAN